MKDHLEEKISLSDIARHVGYSVPGFNVIFSQKNLITPIAYYNQLRIQRACSYLQFSDLKIKEIAFRLKFYDQFHFSKIFRQEIGISPREYRQQHLDNRQKFGV
jgi:transcriptional regulator GlxA family with amidase domain